MDRPLIGPHSKAEKVTQRFKPDQRDSETSEASAEGRKSSTELQQQQQQEQQQQQLVGRQRRLPCPIVSSPMWKYEKIKEIGKGSFGEAILVKDITATFSPKGSGGPKLYVIKSINIARLSLKDRNDAINEVRLLSSLRHPYIISYRESFVHAGNMCIVMEYADGGDLFRVISRQRKKDVLFPESQILRWFTQATMALKHLHSRHILHRDLKSQNMFLTTSGRLCLGDFGIATTLGGTTAFAQTQIGTPYYLSPEICENHPYSWASDIWSLGCVLFELATLKVPFDGPNLGALLAKITRQQPPPLPDGFSHALRRLCASCLHRDWRQRPSASTILQQDIIKNEIRTMLLEQHRRRRHGRVPSTALLSAVPKLLPHPTSQVPLLVKKQTLMEQRLASGQMQYQRYSIVGDEEVPAHCSNDTDTFLHEEEPVAPSSSSISKDIPERIRLRQEFKRSFMSSKEAAHDQPTKWSSQPEPKSESLESRSRLGPNQKRVGIQSLSKLHNNNKNNDSGGSVTISPYLSYMQKAGVARHLTTSSSQSSSATASSNQTPDSCSLSSQTRTAGEADDQPNLRSNSHPSEYLRIVGGRQLPKSVATPSSDADDITHLSVHKYTNKNSKSVFSSPAKPILYPTLQRYNGIARSRCIQSTKRDKNSNIQRSGVEEDQSRERSGMYR